MEPEREINDYAEVSAAAAKCPEQRAVLVLRSADDTAVRRHDRRRSEVVEREPVQPDQMPDPPAERQPCHSGIAEGPTRRRKALALTRWVQVLPKGTAAAGRGSRLWIHDNLAHQAQVGDETPVADAMTGDAVAAPSDGDRKIYLGRERDRRDDIVHIQRPSHEGRPPVEHAVEGCARRLVGGVLRCDERPSVLPTEVGEGQLLKNSHAPS